MYKVKLFHECLTYVCMYLANSCEMWLLVWLLLLLFVLLSQHVVLLYFLYGVFLCLSFKKLCNYFFVVEILMYMLSMLVYLLLMTIALYLPTTLVLRCSVPCQCAPVDELQHHL